MFKEVKKKLKDLDFNDNEVKIYMALTVLGESTAAKIAKKADLPRTTAISVLNKLKESNYISANRYKGTTYFWIESPKTISESFQNKIKIAESLSDILINLYRTEAGFPYAQIYDTKSGIKKFFEKILGNLEKNSIICTIDTPRVGNYSKIFSEDFIFNLNEVKMKKKITTMTLISYDSFETINPKKIETQNIILREMPADIAFNASLWIIGDKVVLFSANPPFIVLIKHKIIVESMKGIFDYIWKISTPLVNKLT